MKAIGSVMTLRAASWEGRLPLAGEFLVSATGRTYEIEKVNDRLPLKLRCVVVPSGSIQSGERWHHWFWCSRTRKHFCCVKP